MSALARFRGSRPALAIALPLPVLAWYGAQQGLGVLVRLRCASAEGPGLVVGVLALLGCVLAVWLSRGSRPSGDGPPARNDDVLRMLVLLGAAVFGLAIAFQTLAVLIVPSCAR